jgi:uncharacterized membrane protein YgaE (UPF0421/DUF939 family)
MTAFLTRTIDSAHAAVQRLRGVLWPIAEASVAAGVAWYVAHDVLGHPDPFFAPIAAAAFVSASNVFQAQRAIQNIVGVALGICLGATVQQLFGTEWIAMAAMVFVALCAAVLLGQGILARDLTFANQTAGSAILVMALSVGTDSVFQRLQEALIGGGVALLLSIVLFPPDPHTALRNARIGVLGALHDVLAETEDRVGGGAVIPSDWQYSAVDQLHERLDALSKARTHARHLVWIAPRRWAARDTVRAADRQAAQVALLAGSLLYLARTVTTAFGVSGSLPQPVHDAISDLAAGLAHSETDPGGASARVAATREHVAVLDSAGATRTNLALTNVVETCVEDLQLVIDLRQ